MWALVLHGGATEISKDKESAFRDGCKKALATGQAILEEGGSAVEAVVATVAVLEDDPTFNAGYGCALNAAGGVELSAVVMNGKTYEIGAMAGLKTVKNPVKTAAKLLGSLPIFLIGEGATQFAKDHGADMCRESALKIAEQKHKVQDTVGCVALDMDRNFAVASSTGGIAGSHVGRVGDTPMPGCGFYAENGAGAVNFSGDGEFIARMMLSARVMHGMAEGGPLNALEDALSHMARIGGEAGGIAIDKNGNVGWAHNNSDFSVGIARQGAEPVVYLRKSEERAQSLRAVA